MTIKIRKETNPYSPDKPTVGGDSIFILGWSGIGWKSDKVHLVLSADGHGDVDGDGDAVDDGDGDGDGDKVHRTLSAPPGLLPDFK